MKTIILGCLITISGILSAQNYRLIPSGINCYINDTGYIRAIRLDSAVVTGTDSLYYNFSRIGLDTTCSSIGCNSRPHYGYSINGPSWIGKHYGVKSNGVQYFLDTLALDTIAFNTLATVNDRWHLYTYANGDYIEATIVSASFESVFSTQDSVKYISLTTKNSSGQSISSAFDNKVLKLSKNHGLLTCLNFQSMPNDTAIYDVTSIRPLTRRQVYDFNVGDIVQLFDLDSSYIGNQVDSIIVSYVYLDKVNVSTDQVNYIVQQTSCNLHSYWCTIDTLNQSYSNLDSLIFSGMPEEGIATPDLMQYSLHQNNAVYNGKVFILDHGHALGNFGDSITGNCHYAGCAVDGGWGSEVFIAGLGDFWTYSASGWGAFYQDLYYYKKGTEEWGTFFTGVNEVPQTPLQVYLSPNPADDKVDFHFNTINGSAISIQITDITGRQLLNQENATANSVSINTTSLSNGLYLYHIKCGSNYATGKLVIAR